MNGILSSLLALLAKTGAVLIVANEIRGLILAVPVIYAMFQAGGTLMAIWLGFCALAGIALSIILPLFLARKLRLHEWGRKPSRLVPAIAR